MTNIQKLIAIGFLSFLLLLLLPLLSLVCCKGSISGSEMFFPIPNSETTVTVLTENTGKRVVISETEYICGAVACEMLPDCEDEALKAQAVIARTLLRRQRLCSDTSVSASDSIPHLSDVPSSTQGYLTAAQRKVQWGEAYPQNEARLERLVTSVAGEYLAYDGQPILAAYHAVSCGTTEDASNVWGAGFPYLLPVGSSDDITSEEYHSSAAFTADEFRAICREKLGLLLHDDLHNIIGACTRSASGYVTDCEIGGVHISGQKIRNAFGLRSACFTLKYADGRFLFGVRGWGHGVGLSQYGANEMAKQGADYREILARYYPGTAIVKETDVSA